MSALARKHDGLMVRSVREALGSVFAADARDRLLEDAITDAGVETVPEEAERARDFVEGPLRRAVLVAAGAEAADAVVDGLDPILQMAGSHVRLRRRDDDDTQVRLSRSTLPAPPSEDGLGLVGPCPVLMATLDRTGVDGVARCLVGRADVRQICDVFDLVSAMDASAGRGALLVIDCCLPAVDPATVATMLPVIPPGAHVILWGATERMRAEMAIVTPIARDFIACSADATHEDLAALLASLM